LPRKYKVENIKIPVGLFHGGKDGIVDVEVRTMNEREE